MTPKDSDFWANLLWKNYLPLIQSGASFYLAADRNLIHAFAKTEDPDIGFDDSLLSFNQACLYLIDRKPTRASIKENAFNKVPSKPYSRAICLAVQQVLVVETMLSQEDFFSERAYFPRYRACLGISDGHQHENPLSSGFQRIWSTLRNEILNVEGSTQSTVTFTSGTARIDVNRNLPLSQALFTTHDLLIVMEQLPSIQRTEDDNAILQNIYGIRMTLNRRAQELIAKASSNQRLCKRLSEQIRSFVPESVIPPTKTRAGTTPETRSCLVASLDLDNDDWLEDAYCIYKRTGDIAQLDKQVTEDDLMPMFSANNIIALARREDHYEELSSSNLFEPGDRIMLLCKRDQHQSLLRRFSEIYGTSKPSALKSNVDDQFLLLYCGELPHSQLFDPFGRKSKAETQSSIEFVGGLLVDARSNTFLVGYTPTAILHHDSTLPGNAGLLVNGMKTTVEQFLHSMSLARQLTSFIVQVGDDRLEVAVVLTSLKAGGQLLFGYPLDSGQFAPTAVALNEQQPSLRGTVIIEESWDDEQDLIENLNAVELLILIEKGNRIPLSQQSVSALINAIRNSELNPQLVEVAARAIEHSKSVPITAAHRPFMQRLLE